MPDLYSKIGTAVVVMGLSPQYCKYPVACVRLWLEPAIRLDQIHFFRDEAGIPVGYMTWAWLAEDAEYRLIHDPEVLLHLGEWNEGDRLWILDFVLLDRDLRPRLREAAALFAAHDCAKSLRRYDNGTVRKVTTWHRKVLMRTSQLTK